MEITRIWAVLSIIVARDLIKGWMADEEKTSGTTTGGELRVTQWNLPEDDFRVVEGIMQVVPLVCTSGDIYVQLTNSFGSWPIWEALALTKMAWQRR